MTAPDWSWNDGLCPVCNRPPGAHHIVNDRCATAPWPPQSVERWKATHPVTDTISVATHGEEQPIAEFPLAPGIDPDEIARYPYGYGQARPDPGAGFGPARICSCSGAANAHNINPDCPTHGVFRRGAPKTTEAAAAAFDAITDEARRRHDAEYARKEAEIRAALVAKIEDVLYDTARNFGDAAGHLGGDGARAQAEAAVDAVADFYREGRKAMGER